MTQCRQIDLEDEDRIEQLYEGIAVSNSAAEEGHRLALIGDKLPDCLDAPQVMVMGGDTGDSGHRCACLRVPLVCQLPVPMD